MDELTIEQAHAIINREDPRGEKYWHNDKAIVEAVNRAFERAHPGQVDLGADPALEEMLNQSLQGKKQPPAEVTAEEQAALAEFQSLLKQDPEIAAAGYDETISAAKRGHEILFGDRDVAGHIDGNLSEEEKVLGIKLLSKIGRAK